MQVSKWLPTPRARHQKPRLPWTTGHLKQLQTWGESGGEGNKGNCGVVIETLLIEQPHRYPAETLETGLTAKDEVRKGNINLLSEGGKKLSE